MHLIHDDLQDRDLLRRGLPTIGIDLVINKVINLGDYFISGSFEILTNINKPITSVMQYLNLARYANQKDNHEILGRSDFDLQMEDYESTAKANWRIDLLYNQLIMILKGKN